jgi:ABC-type glycerol-3-phosphate transport system substrate-binding protein
MARLVVVAYTIVLVLVFGLGACGGESGDVADQEDPAGDAAGGPVEITMWHSEVAANKDALDRLASRYNSCRARCALSLSSRVQTRS